MFIKSNKIYRILVLPYVFSISCSLFANPAFASECVDTDGDGWGWDGQASCLIVNSLSSTDTTSSECVDTDGDGWGWDGTASCTVENTSSDSNTTSGECVGTDGAGVADFGLRDGRRCIIVGERTRGFSSQLIHTLEQIVLSERAILVHLGHFNVDSAQNVNNHRNTSYFEMEFKNLNYNSSDRAESLKRWNESVNLMNTAITNVIEQSENEITFASIRNMTIENVISALGGIDVVKNHDNLLRGIELQKAEISVITDGIYNGSEGLEVIEHSISIYENLTFENEQEFTNVNNTFFKRLLHYKRYLNSLHRLKRLELTLQSLT